MTHGHFSLTYIRSHSLLPDFLKQSLDLLFLSVNILYVSLEDREVKVILVPILKNNDEYVQIPCVYVYRHIRIFMYIQGW